MIVVTGATGELGAEVVKNLLTLVPPSRVAVSVREPKRAHPLAELGVDVRHGDYDRLDTLDRAFAGADRLLIVSASGIQHERRVTQHRNAIRAAERVNVKHVFYTSLVHGHESVAYVMKAHIDTERILRGSTLPFTILQNGIYAEAVDTYLGDCSRGEVIIPADGPIAWVSRADLGAGIALLLRDGGHQGETLRLTGPATLTIRSVAQILSAARGRTIEARIVPVEEYLARQASAGKPVERARDWASTYFAMARGEFATVDPFLQGLLGRPLRTAEQALRLVSTDSAIDL
jgi:uncharacterized protein YbjT (DUF2867 family)